ncbi:kinase-like domain-containing protein [Obelidium mucronatum]|nr:kinase-like domain-containing protein [Obelidium mucronatum]
MISPYPTQESMAPLLWQKNPKTALSRNTPTSNVIMPPELFDLVVLSGSLQNTSLNVEQKARAAVALAFIHSPREFTSRYRVLGIIGYGTNGVVLSALDQNGAFLAVKIIYKAKPAVDVTLRAPSEIRYLKQLTADASQTKLLKYIHDWQDSHHFYLVTERFGSDWLAALRTKHKPLVFQTVSELHIEPNFQTYSFPVYPGGCDAWAWSTVMKKYLSRTQGHEILPLEYIKQIIFQTAQGLEVMHSAGFYHGDIKLENILLQSALVNGVERLWVKLADFGATKRIRIGYEGRDSWDDVRALGCVFRFLMSTDRQMDHSNREAFDLMLKMGDLDIYQILDHSWFAR